MSEDKKTNPKEVLVDLLSGLEKATNNIKEQAETKVRQMPKIVLDEKQEKYGVLLLI